MLKRLKIRNYALIRELDVEFHPGFTIITGETGAGKSILLGALSLILGQRADTTALKDSEKKCVVEGVFNVKAYGLKELFEQYDLDYEDQAIFRREISPSGKSRAFVNDTPVNLKAMRDLGLRLVDIHSQHQNLELNNQHFQLTVVDLYAGHNDLLVSYREKFRVYRKTVQELNALVEKAEQSKADLDYFRFQFEQLESAALVDGEQEEMEKELETLNHAEEIKGNLTQLFELLNGEGPSVVRGSKDGMSLLSKVSKFFPEGEDLHQRLESAYLELKDIADEAERAAESVEYDPGRIEFLNERLDSIYTLQQKHRVETVAELIEIRESLDAKLSDIDSYDLEIEKLEKQRDAAEAEVKKLAEQLSEQRKEVLPAIEERVNNLLLQLGMPNSRFRVELASNGTPSATGIDEVSFMFSANKNAELCEISKVASGGEMSRLMLSLKSLISKSKALPTIIFDEIDSGISGEIAGKMGGILKEMSGGMQVINITHLPQVAAKGDYHFWVYKQDTEHETVTHLKLLSEKERVEELAKMLSGENISDAALQNAQELLR
ncbi:DNA repair protein RecN [Prolixibacter denitrificans]|uniref:DNA repair protein RecN n=1 Tax=Prolixibacter denitrificans TaxID=1541063 RepID=A0A2P8CBD7_9BACT|nr:DNA repair protein RecN [Prolixibacter denitrificans]PSK82283.1 DNA repair protein RecN (Recombination protein N) [Prolixibacter denitrificans]GET22968.1 DNA repair protein RecN [Prolixibacter denitrificans]